ncbi:unnamed protein product [Amoebophrya sp. A25]|nr:unnamed protein product [Amoebophrya sp. A25]|eukprot:GSA25T00007807001.1
MSLLHQTQPSIENTEKRVNHRITMADKVLRASNVKQSGTLNRAPTFAFRTTKSNVGGSACGNPTSGPGKESAKASSPNISRLVCSPGVRTASSRQDVPAKNASASAATVAPPAATTKSRHAPYFADLKLVFETFCDLAGVVPQGSKKQLVVVLTVRHAQNLLKRFTGASVYPLPPLCVRELVRSAIEEHCRSQRLGPFESSRLLKRMEITEPIFRSAIEKWSGSGSCASLWTNVMASSAPERKKKDASGEDNVATELDPRAICDFFATFLNDSTFEMAEMQRLIQDTLPSKAKPGHESTISEIDFEHMLKHRTVRL